MAFKRTHLKTYHYDKLTENLKIKLQSWKSTLVDTTLRKYCPTDIRRAHSKKNRPGKSIK